MQIYNFSTENEKVTRHEVLKTNRLNPRKNCARITSRALNVLTFSCVLMDSLSAPELVYCESSAELALTCSLELSSCRISRRILFSSVKD